jgi:TPR repeat protein
VALRAAEAGDTSALTRLATMREQAEDRQGAEALALRAAEAGDGDALTYLAQMRVDVGDQDDAKALLHRAADAGVGSALAETRPVAAARRGPGRRQSPVPIWPGAERRARATMDLVIAGREPDFLAALINALRQLDKAMALASSIRRVAARM